MVVQDTVQIEAPEMQVLLGCVAGNLTTDQIDALHQSIGRVTDWRLFVRLAQRHRIIPQVFRTLDHCKDAVPAEVMAELRLLHERCVFDGMLMQAEAARVARAFHAENIALIGLKGPIVEQQVYAQGHRRQYRDLDLLVRPETLASSCVLLKQLGYEGQVAAIEKNSPTQMNRLTRYYKHVHGHRMAGAMPLVVELHWRLGGTPQMFAACETEIWQRPAFVKFADTQIRALPPHELLIFLAYHGGRHRWKRLSWLCDFARAVEQTPEQDWETIFGYAGILSLKPYVDLALSVLDELVPRLTLPQPVRKNLSQCRGLSRALASSRHAIVADELYYENQPLSNIRWLFELEHSLSDRLHGLASMLAPADDDIIERGFWRANFGRLRHVGKRTLSVLFGGPANLDRKPAESLT